MSALPQISPGGNLFNKGGSGLGSFEYSEKESRNSYNVGSKKKHRAPPPPTGLGQYKPKILNSDSSINVPVHRADDSPVPPPRPSRGRDSRNVSRSSDVGSIKPVVMGDKDVPVMLPSQHDPQDVALNVSSLNLTAHDTLNDGQEVGTDNPLFSLHDESTATPNSTDSPFASTCDQSTSSRQPTANPLFTALDESLSVPHHQLDSDLGDTDDKTEDREGVYIPAPDYEEEELTMAIPEEPDEEYHNKPPRSTQVYKEYDGEDFGQYLSDEENDFEALRRLSRTNVHMNSKSKTEVRRPQTKKREPLPVKNKKDKRASGYSSLRTFSYADSKFGTLIGKKKNEGRLSRPEDTMEAELFVDTEASYEQFLYSKSGGDLGQAGGVHSYRQEVSAADNTGQSHSQDSVWKKRSWKVKKQTNSFDLTASS